jgi:CheY-like chemotaxis protein
MLLNPMRDKTFVTAPIVVVEDDVDDQFLIQKVFKRIGIHSDLIFFNNGKEALDYLKSTAQPIFMILSDINMPVMNGLELRSGIVRDDNLRKRCIPFIFLSTAARPSDVSAAHDLTVQGFFLKESTLGEMEKALENIVQYWARCKHPNNVGAHL